MAYIVPSDITQLALAGCHEPELETLARLKKELSVDYTVFHGVHWTREYRGQTVYGELDFVVVNRAGRALLIEQKNGRLEETGDGLRKRYDGGARSITEQIRRSLEKVREKFKWQHSQGLELDYLFYCPDYRVRDVNAAGIDAARIVDATAAEELAGKIDEVLSPGEDDAERRDRVERFFHQSFDIAPDVHAYVEAGDKAFARLSGGLADVVSNIEMDPLRLRVTGVPGCGKTVVAERFYARALEQGCRPLLVCFNRPLMERLKRRCPDGGVVQTWYGLAAKFLEAQGETIDYAKMHTDPEFWTSILDRVIAREIPGDWTFDTLIVDEGQDFQAEWLEVLQLFGRDQPDVLWLEDQDQNIRGEAPVELDGFVGYRARANHRSPESIARFMQKALPFDFECANDLPGLGVAVHRYDEEGAQPKIVGKVAAALLDRGFRPEDVVVLTLRGSGSSVFSSRERVGNHTLRRFTGDYDLLGNQVLTAGQVRFESIYRFKGQQAPAVVLVDVAREQRSEEAFHRLLYAAMSRATVSLDIVASAHDAATDRLVAASY